jgi:Holliday junction resolvase-like predicted endonuclease
MQWIKKLFSSTSPAAETFGQFGERVARERYERDGYRVLERNVAARSSRQIGEVDFIARRGQELAFVEV